MRIQAIVATSKQPQPYYHIRQYVGNNPRFSSPYHQAIVATSKWLGEAHRAPQSYKRDLLTHLLPAVVKRAAPEPFRAIEVFVDAMLDARYGFNTD